MTKKLKSSVTGRVDANFFLLHKKTLDNQKSFLFKISHNTSDGVNKLMKIEVTSDCVTKSVENHDEDKYHSNIDFFLRL